MKKAEEAQIVFNKSIEHALGYIELAKLQTEMGLNSKVMADAALKALREFSDNDDYIDAMYDDIYDKDLE